MYASAKQSPLNGVYGTRASEITRAWSLGLGLAWMAWGLLASSLPDASTAAFGIT